MTAIRFMNYVYIIIIFFSHLNGLNSIRTNMKTTGVELIASQKQWMF